MIKTALFVVIAWFSMLITCLSADELFSSWQVPHTFSCISNTGPDSALFVVGSADEMGAWDPVHSVRLTWTEGNVWTGSVSLPAGEQHTYKFIKRNMAADQYCLSDNVEWMPGDDLVISNVAIPPAPYDGKTVYYHSTWSNLYMRYRCGSTQWVDAAMDRVAQGRTDNESLYKINRIGINDQLMEFVFHGMSNGVEVWDNSPYEGPENGSYNYYTALDTFWVQDRQLFNYEPPEKVSDPRIEERLVGSTVTEIPQRNIRIYFPRGYDTNHWKRYPVFYMHDGQAIYEPGNGYGCWGVESLATREIGQGRMRECIIVGINNNTDPIDNGYLRRHIEYNPPGDRYYTNCAEGIGDKYLAFFAQNVRPTLDYNYRTLTNRDDTFIGGSSMGGLISIYFGYSTNIFGGVMAMSPAATRATNFVESLWNESKREMRIYIDTGNNEGSVGTGGGDYWYKPWYAYAIFLQQGYAANDDLMMRIGCGHQHNEYAWSNRYPEAVQFLLDIRLEVNRLALQEHPPVIRGTKEPGNQLTLATSSLRGSGNCIYWRESMVEGVWQTNRLTDIEEDLWGSVVFTNSVGQGYYRVSAKPE